LVRGYSDETTETDISVEYPLTVGVIDKQMLTKEVLEEGDNCRSPPHFLIRVDND
jgi:hypothetical protein